MLMPRKVDDDDIIITINYVDYTDSLDSDAIPPYRIRFLAGSLNRILCPHTADECNLVVQNCCVHSWGCT